MIEKMGEQGDRIPASPGEVAELDQVGAKKPKWWERIDLEQLGDMLFTVCVGIALVVLAFKF